MISNHQMDLALGGADTYPPLSDYLEIQTLYEPNFDSSITVSSFDNSQELFWTGNNEACFLTVLLIFSV